MRYLAGMIRNTNYWKHWLKLFRWFTLFFSCFPLTLVVDVRYKVWQMHNVIRTRDRMQREYTKMNWFGLYMTIPCEIRCVVERIRFKEEEEVPQTLHKNKCSAFQHVWHDRHNLHDVVFVFKKLENIYKRAYVKSCHLTYNQNQKTLVVEIQKRYQ